MCDLLISYIPENDTIVYQITATPQGTFNGKNYYFFDLTEGSMPVGTAYIYFDLSLNQWVANNVLGSTPIEAFLNTTDDCPIGMWNLITSKLELFETTDAQIQLDCECGIQLVWFNEESGIDWNLELVAFGISNGRKVYQFTEQINGISYTFILGWNPLLFRWEIGIVETFETIAALVLNASCPIGTTWIALTETKTDNLQTSEIECETCDREERVFREYDSIKLPETFVEDKRGDISCCCKYMVLAGNGTETWKNDKTSAWIKISNAGDVFTFNLTKNGIPANYIPIPKPFINELNAYFTTIEWFDVLNSDGIGCYHLSIDYEISGIVGSIAIGDFDLKFYSVENALKTARVRAIFDGVHETDGINFSGSGVESTFRFFGYIGNRQPNTEIDNIIYQNREMKRVIRENLNTYELITDPENECIIKPLLDLYLLSENQLFISDYNAHNHSYRYLDIPVTLNESASVEYKDFSRLAVLKCTLEDKFKTNRTYYG